MRFHTEYVIAMEHQVKQDGKIVDCNLSYIVALGPANEKTAIDFFEKTKNNSYTNIYGVENSATVRAVYRRFYK
jgi:hypothetical protein